MDVETFRSIHRYGAILSVVAVFGAVLAVVVGGPVQSLVFPLGFFGPLCSFYFVGAVLDDHPEYYVVGEELMRGVAWYGMSIFGWAFVLSSDTPVPATPATVLGLPAGTALAICLATIGVRHSTGLDLKVQTAGGQLLSVITGAIVGGFLVLYTILVQGQSPLLVVLYVIAVLVGVFIWWRHWRR
ncbi:MAG: hypothetical protein ABEJ94_09285 [Halorientalis sp.]